MDSEVYIVSSARTPIGAFNGCLSSLAAHELGAVVIRSVLAKAKISTEVVSEVILGHVLTAGQGQNPARQASLLAGLPNTVPAWGVNMVCGSGLRAVVLAAQAIALGDSHTVVAGGQESMSKAPHAVHMRVGTKMGSTELVDTCVHDGLTDAILHYHMGVTAENVASRWGVTRGQQDRMAAESQRRCAAAVAEGCFTPEITPVSVPGRKGPTVVEADEFPKPQTTEEGLSRLRPCFAPADGTVTAGNASGINDGAAAVLLMSKSAVTEHGVTPVARVVAWAQAGVDPAIMGTGPIPALTKALEKAGWTVADVDLFELNEAFAAQSLAVMQDLQIPADKVNVWGGSIALGHPIGASGARILVTLLHTMTSRGARRGVAALCVGGGMGIALCVEAC